MLGFIIAAFKIIFLLGFLIFIHELGHFTVAKFCKVKVNEFAIGFGPAIWKNEKKETKYVIRLIPLGGYVSMEGEEERSEDTRSFSEASICKRIAIVAAGATVNILFALIIYFILVVSNGTYISNEVGELIPGYAAQEAGIKSKDKIIEVNNKKILKKYDLDIALRNFSGDNLQIKIERDGEILEFNIKPTKEENHFYIGVNLIPAEDNIRNRLENGIIETKEFVISIGENLKDLFTGNVGIDQMMGPVGISEVVSKTNGVKEFIGMMALISLSLGVTNLLPIPALDGGKILIILIEAIRKKPMNQQTEINIQLLGFCILIGLSIYVTYNDIIRVFKI